MTSKPQRNGNLTAGVTDRAGGRKIDTWTFRSGGSVSKLVDTDITFDVFLQKTLDFRVETKNIPSSRWQTLVGSDLAALQAQALEKAQAEFDLKNDLVWSDWLEIRIKEAAKHDTKNAIGAGQAAVIYSPILRAETADGRAFTVNGNGLLVNFPEAVGIDRNSDWGIRSKNEDALEKANASTEPNSAARLVAQLGAQDHRPADTQFVYLPDTPENRMGLDAIINAIEGINSRLQEFLNPAQISDTLQRAATAGSNLLSGPETSISSKRRLAP